MIARQVEQQIARSGNLGGEFERMTSQGRLTPDLWMKKATGAPVGPEPLLQAAERALEQLPQGPCSLNVAPASKDGRDRVLTGDADVRRPADRRQRGDTARRCAPV